VPTLHQQGRKTLSRVITGRKASWGRKRKPAPPTHLFLRYPPATDSDEASPASRASHVARSPQEVHNPVRDFLKINQAEQTTKETQTSTISYYLFCERPGPDGMTRSPDRQFHSETHTITLTHMTTSPATPPGRCPFGPGLDLSGRRWSLDRCCPLPLRPKIRGQDKLQIFIATYQYILL